MRDFRPHDATKAVDGGEPVSTKSPLGRSIKGGDPARRIRNLKVLAAGVSTSGVVGLKLMERLRGAYGVRAANLRSC